MKHIASSPSFQFLESLSRTRDESFRVQAQDYACNTKVGSAMDVDHCQQKEEEEEQEDLFLKFVDYARSELLSLEGYRNKDDDDADGLGWSWIVSRILKTCIAYSSGVTPAILLSELSQAWSEQRWVGAPKKPLELINHLKKNHRRTKLPNTVTIDSIYPKNFLSLNSYGGGPALSHDNHCRDCLIHGAMTVVSADTYRDRRESMKSLAWDILDGNCLDGKYYISRPWYDNILCHLLPFILPQKGD
ncbi:Ubiquitin carboxyl-terminal hydrolase 26 [Glycine soja]